MQIGWCKKLTRGRQVDQSHEPYISWCSHQKQHNLTCFGSNNPSVAPSSGEFQNSDMALKQPEIIEVPDDDNFPDSGPQNPVEAQSYRDKLNAIMNTFSDLLMQRCLEVNCHVPQEAHGEALVADGRGQHRCSAQVHPCVSISISISSPKASM